MKAIAKTITAIASLLSIMAGEAMAIEQAKLFRDPKGSLFLYGLQPDSEIRIGVPLSGVRRIRSGGCGIVSIKPSKRFPTPPNVTVDGTYIDVTKLKTGDAPKCINGVPDVERTEHFVTTDGRVMVVGKSPRVVSEIFYPVESSGRIKKANACGFVRVTLKETTLNLPTTSGGRANFEASNAPSYPQIICKKVGTRKLLYVPPQWPYALAQSGIASGGIGTGGGTTTNTSGGSSGSGSGGTGTGTGGTGSGSTGGTGAGGTPSAYDINDGSGGAVEGAYRTQGSGTGPYSNWNPPTHPNGASAQWVFLPAPAGGAACTSMGGASVVLPVMGGTKYQAAMDDEGDIVEGTSNDQGILVLNYGFDTRDRVFEGQPAAIHLSVNGRSTGERLIPAGMATCRLWPTFNGTYIKFNPDGSTQEITNF